MVLFSEIDISANNFMDVLDNGVYICDLANVIHKKAEECVKEGKCEDVSSKWRFLFFLPRLFFPVYICYDNSSLEVT